MTGMAVKVATAEEGRRLTQLLKDDSSVTSVHPVVSTTAAEQQQQQRQQQQQQQPSCDPASCRLYAVVLQILSASSYVQGTSYRLHALQHCVL
jgi:hypothetical protein